MIDSPALDRTIDNLVSKLLDRRVEGGWWEGYLASSALSTATAVSALSLAGSYDVEPGLQWLANHQNADGGWGDTTLNLSNVSTTVLCWCCFSIANATGRFTSTVASAEEWLCREAGSTDPADLVDAILRRYGNDRTFSAPILTVMAIAGKLGEGGDAWRGVPQLPFELAAFPHQLFAWLRMPVVSYALPALIAIGQVRHRRQPSANPVLRSFRDSVTPGTLRLLKDIQPSTGGYLEATPLTSFVVISLASAGLKHHAVVADGVRFLQNSRRADGSWPIDTNLATWVTTLSVNALAAFPEQEHPLDSHSKRAIREWLLSQQYLVEHPYTHAGPGGWAWTPLPGGVPDADDTAGALLALRNLGPMGPDSREAARLGVRWLLDLRNRDGGMPTFCRGWGKLPFDRSGADLTAHALSAWRAWLPDLEGSLQRETAHAIGRAVSYLERKQKRDGYWIPLWFGNEHIPTEENSTYGTARVLISLQGGECEGLPSALRWLWEAQNLDGGWGGGFTQSPSSIEETALALHALAIGNLDAVTIEAMVRGTAWLIEKTSQGTQVTPTPLGLYFARLWYFEDLYPLIFATGALIRVRNAFR